MKLKKLFFITVAVAAFLGGVFLTADVAFADSGIIQCGKGQDMCTLCNLVEGMNNIIQYLMKIAIGVALLAMSIGGVMYVVSAGDSGLIDTAKGTMKNAAIGFVIIFAGWLIINTTITYLGTKSDMGIKVTSWDKFECTRTVPVSN